MEHLGDITKLNGYELPAVDVIIGGSPCQDLSVAGKRAGLAGARSGLFMEQIRIIKEMREAERRGGKPDFLIRPRFMVWENVPGAFSSNKGDDFRAVLEETIRIADPEAPDVPLPPKGKWPLADCWMGDGWSVACRVLDAQFWGVPQRRRRIALVADFGGHAAPEILFVRQGVCGDIEEGGAARETVTARIETGFGAAIALRMRAGCEGGGKGALIQVGKSGTLGCDNDQVIICLNDQGGSIMGTSLDVTGTLRAEEHGHQPIICAGFQHKAGARTHGIGYEEEKAPTLTSEQQVSVYDARGNGDGKTVCTLTGDHQDRVTDYTAIVYRKSSFGGYKEGVGTLTCGRGAGYSGENLVAGLDCRNGRENGDLCGTLQAKANGGFSYNCIHPVRIGEEIRRLTPLECERLQGYPSIKKVDISKMTKDEYIAWNLSVGNIIADPANGKVFATRGPGGIALVKPKELDGTVVNGYRTVSIRNGTTKLQCRVHRVIWIAAHGIIPDGYCIDHINSNKQDNRIENLQLLTPAENSRKAAEDGLYKTGEDNKATKLSPDLWDEIAYLYDCTDMTIRDLAEIYGVSKSRIHKIIKEIGWTDIGDWTDSKGKVHKQSDSARYKALGNSIAIPPWAWVLKRLCGCYERAATMASLFDGIGGFPLIWERLNGPGSCLWASEIEQFPIAVTKARFGATKEH